MSRISLKSNAIAETARKTLPSRSLKMCWNSGAAIGCVENRRQDAAHEALQLLRTCSGSIRAARRAGTIDATIPTNAKSASTEPSTRQSPADTWNRNASAKDVRDHAAAVPATILDDGTPSSRDYSRPEIDTH